MLEINKNHLNEIEMLLNQSAKGHHFLFDHKQVAKILKIPTENLNFFHKANIQIIQKLLTELLSRKSLLQKKSYLSSLDHHKFEILVRTYFHILDSAVSASTKMTH